MTYTFNTVNQVYRKLQRKLKKKVKPLFILLKKAQAVVQKTSRKNVTSTVLIFSSFLAEFHNKGAAWFLSPFLL